MGKENSRYQVAQEIVVFNASFDSGVIESDPPCSVSGSLGHYSSSILFPCSDRQDVYGMSGTWSNYFDRPFSDSSRVMADFGTCFGVSSPCRSLDVVISDLDALFGLEDGWYWDDWVAYKKDDVEWLKRFFIESYPSTLPYPYIYPMPSGKISIEWDVGDGVDVEFDPTSHTGECFVYGDDVTEYDVNFEDKRSMEVLLNILRKK